MDSRGGEKKKDRWEHPAFVIEVAEKYEDEAYKTLRFHALDLPGIEEVKSDGAWQLRFQHRFSFMLPREYPQNLGKIRIILETPLFHPRITAAGTKACYTVNGEVDRIFNDIIYNVLLRPETVRPPSMFADADWGLDSKKMRWYIQAGPTQVYDRLKKEWQKKQTLKGSASVSKPKKIQILD